MKRKFLFLTCTFLALISVMTSCSFKNNTTSSLTTENTTQTPTLPPNVISDTELARVSTIDKFFNSRSITLNEKVLRFSLDDSQMKYVGFEISSNTNELENIPAGETVENIEYKSETGLTAYVSATNKSNVAVDYTKCKYYSLRLIKGNCKDVTLHLPNKLDWNSTVDIIKQEYGEPVQETQNDEGDTVLLYSDESEKINEAYSIELVTNEKGIKEFTIEFHSLDNDD